ncbi:MAG: sigma-70 family RNA polymerase sigma factor [Ruminococcaceae bacterium]|nr:sigma-70 family RNA polymerase sigma factor [Oscillospiraceae bacterium]
MPDSPDIEIIKELFGTHKEMMFKIALGILHNKSDAEDAVQDAFLAIINNIDKISQIPCRERVFYFVTITENVSINKFNKKKRHPTEDIEEHFDITSNYSVEKTADENLLIKEIKSALTELSDRDYSIIYLYAFKQWPPKEIAKELGIREKNIHTYIDRARKRLVKILNERGIYYDL